MSAGAPGHHPHGRGAGELPPEHLFVYGTLRPAAHSPMGAWLAARAELVGAARAPGRLFDLGAYPGFVPAGAGRVAGEVYRLRAPASILARLDEYEGCGERNAYGAFRRERIAVQLDGGAELEAWTYVHRGPTDESRAIASGDWAAWLAERR
jgi:gamma-glutamylcyclotransferase (GGCT)/AIG2-like uncharacterized protein YtfP